MTNIFNNNFLFGFLLAREREDRGEQLRVGLQASQFPTNNPMGLVLLKGQIDTLQEVEDERAALAARVRQLEAEPGTGTDQPQTGEVALASLFGGRGEEPESGEPADPGTRRAISDAGVRHIERSFDTLITTLKAKEPTIESISAFKTLLIEQLKELES